MINYGLYIYTLPDNSQEEKTSFSYLFVIINNNYSYLDNRNSIKFNFIFQLLVLQGDLVFHKKLYFQLILIL